MNDDDDLFEEFLRYALMEETRSYLERGRTLAHLGKEELFVLWTTLVERWFYDRSEMNQRDMDDAAAEIRFRGLDMPEKTLDSFFEKIKEQVRLHPQGKNEKTKQQILHFFAGRKHPH